MRTIGILERVNDNKQITALEDLLLNDSSSKVRAECAEALKWLESKDSKPILIKSLGNSDKRVRLESALALAALGEKILSLKTLSDIFISANSRDKLACIQGFRDIATNDAIEILCVATNSNDPHVAVYAAIILAQLKYSDYSFPKLEGFLTHDDKYVRMSALSGLAYIGDKKSLDLISQLLNDDELLVRKRAQRILDDYDK